MKNGIYEIVSNRPIALDTYMHRSWDSFAYGGI